MVTGQVPGCSLVLWLRTTAVAKPPKGVNPGQSRLPLNRGLLSPSHQCSHSQLSVPSPLFPLLFIGYAMAQWGLFFSMPHSNEVFLKWTLLIFPDHWHMYSEYCLYDYLNIIISLTGQALKLKVGFLAHSGGFRKGKAQVKWILQKATPSQQTFHSGYIYIFISAAWDNRPK